MPETPFVRQTRLFSLEAAVELLIGHRSWLSREDFVETAVECGRGLADGTVMAAVDWESAIAALDDGRLPCSGGEGQMLRIAASIAGGVLVDLRETVTGLDEGNAILAARAVCHAAGCRQAGAAAGAGW